MRALLLSSLAALLASPALADDLLATARAAGAEGPLYAYEMTYATGEIEARGTVDPTAPEGERIIVTSPPQSEWPDGFAESIAALDAQTTGEIWCGQFLDAVPDTAERTSEADGKVTYTFTPQPDEDADGAERRMMGAMTGTAVLDASDGAVLSFQLHLPESVKPNMFSRIQTFNMFADCARTPDGRTYTRQMDFEISGSALGQSFAERETRTIHRLLEPANP